MAEDDKVFERVDLVSKQVGMKGNIAQRIKVGGKAISLPESGKIGLRLDAETEIRIVIF